ncbi:cupin domain-containing protein [Wenyingzhuangia sp. chi5]|uniref:Cupin domain-containing protein n=1 Tax=Wenyingzhuangia gilva TaxID=3057677 RepID=A0ABT8VPG5_9FLAO|nr:cupin domain-containing protein [Wenyingzhuangia sp. chi5]MDO3693868.1 cupin domain-containing protein [Wenyingzhuangia sp. chi5]
MKVISLLKDIEYKTKPSLTVLFETEFSKEIRIVMKKGQEVKKHQTEHPIIVSVFEGSIEFSVQDEKVKMKKGDMISLDANVPHSLLCTADTIVRLSISKQDTIKRIEDLLF